MPKSPGRRDLCQTGRARTGDDQIGQFYFDAQGEWVDNDDALAGGDEHDRRAGTFEDLDRRLLVRRQVTARRNNARLGIQANQLTLDPGKELPEHEQQGQGQLHSSCDSPGVAQSLCAHLQTLDQDQDPPAHVTIGTIRA